VEEELLYFNDKGDLVNCVKGAKEKRRESAMHSTEMGGLYDADQMSLRSGSTIINPN